MSAALATEHGRQAALRKLDSDVYANSTRAPRNSLWATWVFVAAAWDIPPIPVTEDTVRRVAAGLNIGPSSLKHSFPFEDLAPKVAWPEVAQLTAAPTEGPLFLVALLVVGCWWLRRCIELAAATVEDITLIPERSEARRPAWPSPSARQTLWP